MPELRFLIDDEGQCRTQRAVLSVFAAALTQGHDAKVSWSSKLQVIRYWEDVPTESARRLDLRLQALEPAAGWVTVFLPGHIVPGDLGAWGISGQALATNRFTTVADLDVFVADNGAADLCQFYEHAGSHPDYEAIGRYDQFTSDELPDWLTRGGLVSALSFTQRPWYSGKAGVREQWLGWVQKALEQGALTLAMVEEDVRQGKARPSLIAEVKALLNGVEVRELPDLTLDSLFVFPECRLSATQFQLLNSEDLQRRTLEFAGRNMKRKAFKQKKFGARDSLRRGVKRLRRLLLLCLQAAYTGYAATLRPLVKSLRERNGISK